MCESAIKINLFNDFCFTVFFKEMDAEHRIKIHWSVKGYHHFRIPDIALTVTPEYDNAYDPFAMVVALPLGNTDQHRDQRTGCLVGGRQVGRVPANLCHALRILLDRGFVVDGGVTCQVTGAPLVTNQVPFQRRPGRFDREGGGVELPCWYHVTLRGNFRHAMHIFEAHLPRQDLERLCC